MILPSPKPKWLNSWRFSLHHWTIQATAAQSLSMIWLKLSRCVPSSGSRSYCCLSGATSEKSNTWSAFICQLCARQDSFKFSPCPALLTLTTTHVRLLLYIVTDISPLSNAYPPYYYHNNAWWISPQLMTDNSVQDGTWLTNQQQTVFVGMIKFIWFQEFSS